MLDFPGLVNNGVDFLLFENNGLEAAIMTSIIISNQIEEEL